jgi:hypothetical protein
MAVAKDGVVEEDFVGARTSGSENPAKPTAAQALKYTKAGRHALHFLSFHAHLLFSRKRPLLPGYTTRIHATELRSVG